MNANTEAMRAATPVASAEHGRNDWIEKGAEEARAHNARRFRTANGMAEAMRVSAEAYAEMAREPWYRVMLGGTYLFFWGLLAFLAIVALA